MPRRASASAITNPVGPAPRNDDLDVTVHPVSFPSRSMSVAIPTNPQDVDVTKEVLARVTSEECVIMVGEGGSSWFATVQLCEREIHPSSPLCRNGV